jgi:hypothetical protein
MQSRWAQGIAVGELIEQATFGVAVMRRQASVGWAGMGMAFMGRIGVRFLVGFSAPQQGAVPNGMGQAQPLRPQQDKYQTCKPDPHSHHQRVKLAKVFWNLANLGPTTNAQYPWLGLRSK